MRDSYMWHSSFAEAKAYVTDLPSTRDAYVYSKEAPMSKTDLPYGSITGRQAFQRKDRYADRTQNGKTLAFKAPAPISIDRVPRLLHVTDEGVISTDYRSQELWAAPKHDAVQVSPVQQLWQAGADVFAGSAEHELSQLRMKNAGKDPERFIARSREEFFRARKNVPQPRPWGVAGDPRKSISVAHAPDPEIKSRVLSSMYRPMDGQLFSV
jgi:hypothetical protein